MYQYIAIIGIILFIYKKYISRIFKKSTGQVSKDKIVSTLLRQTYRWATASKQDSSPMISMLHANYAVGYLSALKELVSDEDIASYGETDPLYLMQSIQELQDYATSSAIQMCPEFKPDSPF